MTDEELLDYKLFLDDEAQEILKKSLFFLIKDKEDNSFRNKCINDAIKKVDEDFYIVYKKYLDSKK